MKKNLILSIVFCLIFLSNASFAKQNSKEEQAPKKQQETFDTPAVSLNFETKKPEIFEILQLDDKQQLRIEKKYNKSKDKIMALNKELALKMQEKRELKLSSANSRESLNKLVKLSEEIQILYQKRDKINNTALKNFESSLKKDQLKTWQYLKIRGVRLYPELDSLILPAS